MNEIRLKVDLSNPGQVFGCCGLFEIVHSLAEKDAPPLSWFERPADESPLRTTFHLQSSLSLDDVLKKLKGSRIVNISESYYVKDNAKDGPVAIAHSDSSADIIIDWRKAYPYSHGAHNVKTWAARQNIRDFMKACIEQIPEKSDEDLLAFRSPLYKCDGSPMASIGFDVSRAHGALDSGFPLDDFKKIYCQFAIVSEMLSLIGNNALIGLT